MYSSIQYFDFGINDSGSWLRAFFICFCQFINVVSKIWSTLSLLFGLLAADASTLKTGIGNVTESYEKNFFD